LGFLLIIGHFPFISFHFEEGLLSPMSVAADVRNVTHIRETKLKPSSQMENEKRKMTNEK